MGSVWCGQDHNTTVNGIQQSREFITMANSEMRSGATSVTGSGSTLRELEAEYERPSRQRGTARASTSTKHAGTNKMAPPLGASMGEVLTRIVDIMGEKNEKISIRMSKLERAVHDEREILREKINRNKLEASKSNKCLKERTDDYLARNLSRMTREAEEREKRLRGDLE